MEKSTAVPLKCMCTSSSPDRGHTGAAKAVIGYPAEWSTVSPDPTRLGPVGPSEITTAVAPSGRDRRLAYPGSALQRPSLNSDLLDADLSSLGCHVKNLHLNRFEATKPAAGSSRHDVDHIARLEHGCQVRSAEGHGIENVSRAPQNELSMPSRSRAGTD